MKLLKIQSDFINLDMVTHIKRTFDYKNNQMEWKIYFSGGGVMFFDSSKASRELYDRLTNLCEVVI